MQDTFKLNWQQVVRLRVTTMFNNLITLDGDTLVEARDAYFDWGFPDVDGDGYKDIRVYEVDNDPTQWNTYLFDKTDKTYKETKNVGLDFKRFPKSIIIFIITRLDCRNAIGRVI